MMPVLSRPSWMMKSQRWSLVHLLIAWFVGAIGLICGILLEPGWFSRFGALIVFFGAAAEYELLQLDFDWLRQGLTADRGVDARPSVWQTRKQWMAHITVGSGTVIWGFGDLVL